MHFSQLDAYFCLASQGDNEAQYFLYNEIHSRGITIIKILLANSSNLAVFPEDFTDYLDFLYFKVLDEYDSNRGSFTWFVEYMLSKRLTTKIITKLVSTREGIGIRSLPIGEEDYFESQSYPDQTTMTSEIAVEDFKLRMASPNKYKNQLQRTIDKILYYRYLGYKDSEICEILKITRGQFRIYLKRMVKNEDVINLKLELK